MLVGLAVLWAALAVSAAHPLRSSASASKHQRQQLAARAPQSQYVPPQLDFAAVKGDGAIKSSAYKRLTDMLPTILTNGNQVTKHSWEIGAYTQALLEVYNPNLTPFRYDPSAVEKYDRAPWAVLRIAQASLYAVDWSSAPASASSGALGARPKLGDYLDERKNGETGVYAAPLIPGDGSLGDPAALGVATWILAQYSRGKNVQDFLGRGARTPEEYAWAVGAQLQMLRQGVHSQNGTISQREDHFELWADQGFMIPPFAAHLGMATRSLDLLGMALHQWALESSALLDPAQNLFRHVNAWDARFWATGNGWMLLGAIRTLASTWSASQEGTFWDMANPIINTLDKVFAALFDQLDDDSLLPNYMLQHDTQAAIGDAAGTAAVVAAFYRYADLFPWHVGSGVQVKAEKAFDGVMAKVNGTGWLTQVVDPMGTNGFMVWPERQQVSPEGQTFLGMMWAARTAAGF